MLSLVGWILEFDHMQVILELDIYQLVSRPEFGIDSFVELDYLLVIFSFGHIWSLHKERNPIISPVAIEMCGQEIISIHIVFSILIDIDHHVDLVASIDVMFRQPLVNQSDKSALLV